jgi:acyl transferase domain-containing protein
VQSFGFGGTNAHIVLEDASYSLQHHDMTGSQITERYQPRDENPSIDSLDQNRDTTRLSKLLVLSTADKNGVDRLSTLYQEFLLRKGWAESIPATDLENLIYTLAQRRTRFAWRSFAVIESSSALKAFKQLRPPTLSISGRKLGFVFTGQGAQWTGMGRELLGYPAFARSIENSDRVLRGLECMWSLKGRVTCPYVLLQTRHELTADRHLEWTLENGHQ